MPPKNIWIFRDIPSGFHSIWFTLKQCSHHIETSQLICNALVDNFQNKQTKYCYKISITNILIKKNRVSRTREDSPGNWNLYDSHHVIITSRIFCIWTRNYDICQKQILVRSQFKHNCQASLPTKWDKLSTEAVIAHLYFERKISLDWNSIDHAVIFSALSRSLMILMKWFLSEDCTLSFSNF